MNDYKNLFNLVKPYWRRVALAGIVSILLSVVNGSLAWFVKPVLDDILISKNTTQLILLPIGVIVIFTLKGIFSFINAYLMSSASEKLLMDLRNKLFNHIIRLPHSFFGRNSSGSLISKVMYDTEPMLGVVSLVLKDLIVQSTTLLVLAAVAVWRRWDLALITLIILPGAFYFAGRLAKRLILISKRTQEKVSELIEILNESFSGIKIIKVFGMESRELNNFKNKTKDYYRENMRTVRVSSFVSILMEIVSGLGMAFAIWYGGRLIVDDIITVGAFFSFITAVLLLYAPAKRLTNINSRIQEARAPLNRVLDILSQQSELDGNINLDTFNKAIQYDRVNFSYPASQTNALETVSLEIKKGEMVALVGKSGSGKTTLINMLPRFYSPDKGHIYIDGVDITTLTLKSLRSLFGVVTQDVILFNDTILANIKYGNPAAWDAEVIEAAKAAFADEFIVKLRDGYNTQVGERGFRLSGGQRQRLSIARAILKNPPILVLDEATSSLDTASEIKIQSALEKLMKNRTTIVIAHRLSTVIKADLIVVMEKGKIIETGTHQYLLKLEGLYSQLYELQFRAQEY